METDTIGIWMDRMNMSIQLIHLHTGKELLTGFRARPFIVKASVDSMFYR